MSSSRSLGVQEVAKILPHRYPFLLVDRIDKLEQDLNSSSRVGWRALGRKNLTVGETFFQGHFPKRPIMPGVLIIEVMAQVAAVASYRPDEPFSDLAICSVKNARFRKPVEPGDSLDVDVVCQKDRGSMLAFLGEARVNGALVAEAEILAMFTTQEVGPQ